MVFNVSGQHLCQITYFISRVMTFIKPKAMLDFKE